MYEAFLFHPKTGALKRVGSPKDLSDYKFTGYIQISEEQYKQYLLAIRHAQTIQEIEP